MHRKLCCNVDLKLDTRLLERYLARVGIFRFKLNSRTKRGIITLQDKRGTLTLQGNICKNEWNGELNRFQIRCLPYRDLREGCLGILMNGGEYFAITFRDHVKLIDISSILRSWTTYSKFVICVEISWLPMCHIVDATNAQPVISIFPEDHVSILETDNEERTLVLPHFDRVDRMLFWKFVTEFHLSKTEFHSSKTESYSLLRSDMIATLTIFIHQYL
jgi:hypothetical protein